MNIATESLAPIDVESYHDLKGKTVLITGGGSGLGAALCAELAAAGANLVVGDVRQDAAQKVLDGVSARAKMHALTFDVGDPAQAERVIQETIERHGRLDVLINNAGTDKTCPIDELDYADWDRVIRTNLYGPFLLTRFAVPHMRRQGQGHIINIASTAAKRTWPNAAAYHASKWGLLGLSHSLHAELRSHGIKVTAVICGGMRTPFLLDRFPDIDVSTLQDPANVARTVLFLLTQPAETVIPEISVLPMRETSWP